MPRTVEQGFKDFHDKIRTSAVETSAAKSHRSSIEASLKNNFGLTRFYRIGSFGNWTNISKHSDVDYLACLPIQSLKQSSKYSLDRVKDALDRRFPSTGVKISSPAVVCPFGTYKFEDTEIVVADYIGTDKGYKVYEIADGQDGWMKTAPDAHIEYVSRVDKKHNGKVKPLIRFIKAWKYYRDVPISSFYLEMWVARYADSQSSIIYDIDIKIILERLLRDELASIQDPMGITGYIYPCRSEAQKIDALSKLRMAATRAENAYNARKSEDIKTAFEWWDKLYCYEFPSYN